MPLLEQQNLLAKLYTDAGVRRRFLEDPLKVGGRFGLSQKEIGDISAVIPGDLELFAETLIRKRLHEVEKFLPLTKENLGDEFDACFFEFSRNTQMRHSVRKHGYDAWRFCKFLLRKGFSGVNHEVISFEQAKLEFFGLRKRFVWRRFHYDFGSMKKLKVRNVKIWFRIGEKEIVL